MKKILFTIATLLCIACAGNASAQDADRITGVYRVIGETTHELSNVRIYKSGDTYEARIIWLEHPNDADGNPRLDELNPDPALRNVPADEIVIVRGLRYDARKDQWTGGKIYNPVDGKVYDAMAEFDSPDVLNMRGYVGKPMFGKTFEWKRLE